MLNLNVNLQCGIAVAYNFMYFRILSNLRCKTKLKPGHSGQYQAEWTMRFHKRHNFLDPLSYISYKLILVTFNHRWAVPQYFLGTGTVGTFLVPVPVPRYFAIFWQYRYFSFVLFFSRDLKKLIKNLKRCKNACD